MTLVDSDVLARAQHAVEEVLPDGVVVEVLDGTLVVTPPPTFGHGQLVERVGDWLRRAAPAALAVNRSGIGVYERDDPHAEYQVPYVVVFRPPPSGTERLVGAEVELVVEIVSPANRRLSDYGTAVAARAARYGVPWTLVIDPDARTASWWRDGEPQSSGPIWSAEFDLAELLAT